MHHRPVDIQTFLNEHPFSRFSGRCSCCASSWSCSTDRHSGDRLHRAVAGQDGRLATSLAPVSARRCSDWRLEP